MGETAENSEKSLNLLAAGEAGFFWRKLYDLVRCFFFLYGIADCIKFVAKFP